MPPAPILWGDGINDDAAALNAMFRGEMVEFSNHISGHGCGWQENTVRIPFGRFRLTAPIEFHGGDVIIDGNGSDFYPEAKHAFVVSGNTIVIKHVRVIFDTEANFPFPTSAIMSAIE